MRRDRRIRVLESALFSPDLSYAEKVFMIVVATIGPEFVNGARRHGSKAMGPDGKFSLHYDYLARATSKSSGAVKKVLRSLADRGHLDLVHEGTFGRPSTWQALVVRGAKNGRVTGCENRTPYGIGDWFVRGAVSAPLTYKTPDHRNHETTPRGLPTTRQQVDGSDEETELLPVRSELTVCDCHGYIDCASLNRPHAREESTA